VKSTRRCSLIATASRLAAAAALGAAAGCATVNGDPRDPLEGFNRAMYTLNEGFDEVVAKPVAGGYREIVPTPVRDWVRNFFANIADVFIGVNNFLQGKPVEAIQDWGRFAFNSTIGLFGVHDIASDMQLEKHNEDFGQTLGVWGIGGGPYLVLPILGSSTFRDTAGIALDFYFDPVRQHTTSFDPLRRHQSRGFRNTLFVLRATSTRADLLDASRILEEAALDKYVFQRDAFLQRRRNLIHDGNPPREENQGARAPSSAASETGDAKVH
jgi:phospholipid-binding lipoprotein MlaA